MSQLITDVSNFHSGTSKRVLITVAGIKVTATKDLETNPNRKFSVSGCSDWAMYFWPSSRKPKYNATPGTTLSIVCNPKTLLNDIYSKKDTEVTKIH